MTTLRTVPSTRDKKRTYETFPEVAQAIYEDKRVGHEARELLLAVAFALYEPERVDGLTPLKFARRELGAGHGRITRCDRIVEDDTPRYKPPRSAQDWHPSGAPSCEAPRLRPYKPRPYKTRTPQEPETTPIRPLPTPIVHVPEGYTPPRDWRTEDGVCGANSHHRVLEKDPRTGWITAHWFCKRHKAHADRVTEQVRAQNEASPEPIPNTGGLLPCYFKADWEKVYQHYRPHWTVPSWGLCADDWPTQDSATPPARGRLRLIAELGDDVL